MTYLPDGLENVHPPYNVRKSSCLQILAFISRIGRMALEQEEDHWVKRKSQPSHPPHYLPALHQRPGACKGKSPMWSRVEMNQLCVLGMNLY